MPLHSLVSVLLATSIAPADPGAGWDPFSEIPGADRVQQASTTGPGTYAHYSVLPDPM